MTDRSLDECRRIVALAIGSCTLPTAAGSSHDEASASFIDLGFDSLAFMEFCIAIQTETGVELSVGVVAEIGSPEAVARYLSGLT